MYSSKIPRHAQGTITGRRALITLTAAILAGCGPKATADGADSPTFSLHGFGTLGAVRSDQNEADVVSSVFLQPNGAGHTSTWHAGVDSKIGGQLDAQFSHGLSGVLQIVSKHRYDNSYNPEIEWANLKYQFTPTVSFRVGRTVASTFMMSDVANVGYANPWIRGPQEIYGMVPITHLDGMDIAWNVNAGSAVNSFQASFGGNTFKSASGDEITGKNTWNVSNTVEYEKLTLRLSYLYVDLTFDSSSLDSLINSLSDVGTALSMSGFPTQGDRALALANRYDLEHAPLEIFGVGTRIDPGNWVFMGEWIRLTDAGILPKTEGWYVMAGYHFRMLTPYITFAELNSETSSQPGIPLGGLPPGPLSGRAAALNIALDTVLNVAAPSQKSFTLGLRWDLFDATALKFEYQHIRLDDLSAGRFGNVQPEFTPGGNADLFSIALDFVF